MDTKVVIQIPVKDLAKAAEFYKAIGFSVTDHGAVMGNPLPIALTLNSEFTVLLIEAEEFQYRIPNKICDATQNTQMIFVMELNSLNKCEQTVQKVVAAGGKSLGGNLHDGVKFQDLDGHMWNLQVVPRGK